MRQLVFEIPHPPKELSGNARCSWQAKARAVKAYRTEVNIAVKCSTPNFPRGMEKATIQHVWYCARTPGRYVPRDDDNAVTCMKAVQDELKSMGVIIDDTSKRVTVLKPQFRRQVKKHMGKSCVWVAVTEVASLLTVEASDD